MPGVLELSIFWTIEDLVVLSLVVKTTKLFSKLIKLNLSVQKESSLLATKRSKFIVQIYNCFVKLKINHVLMTVVAMECVSKITHVNVYTLLLEKLVTKF